MKLSKQELAAVVSEELTPGEMNEIMHGEKGRSGKAANVSEHQFAGMLRRFPELRRKLYYALDVEQVHFGEWAGHFGRYEANEQKAVGAIIANIEAKLGGKPGDAFRNM